jgi:hypothetical protein
MRVAISASALDDKPDGGSSFRLSVALMRLAQRVAAMPYSGAAQGWELLSTKIAQVGEQTQQIVARSFWRSL